MDQQKEQKPSFARLTPSYEGHTSPWYEIVDPQDRSMACHTSCPPKRGMLSGPHGPKERSRKPPSLRGGDRKNRSPPSLGWRRATKGILRPGTRLLTRKTEVWLAIRLVRRSVGCCQDRMDLKSEVGSRRACEGATEKTEALLRSADAELRRAYFALVRDC